MYIFEALYALSNIPFAALNAYWIKKGYKILHGWNGALHLLAAILCSYLYWWPSIFIILANSSIVFDTSLNLFRGLPLNYISSSPRSLIDRLEKKIFKNNFYLTILFYASISITLNVLYAHYRRL